MAKHALLSASGAHRWLLCTPSAQLEQKFPASTSAYAEEGTVAHALAELTTRYFLGELDEVSYENQIKSEFEPNSYYNAEMRECAVAYAKFVTGRLAEAKKTCPDAMIILETRLDFSKYDGYLGIGNGGFTNGVQVIVDDAIYERLTGKDTYSEFLPTLNEGADREIFDTFIEAFCDRTPGTTFLSYEESDQQLKESFAQIQMLAWGLILFVGLIGILNIINTVYTNIHTRVTEIGMQRAIGMSAGSLYKTFLWEGAYYGIIASVIGSVLGYVCTIFIEAATSDTLQLVAIPVIPILEATLLAVGACLMATAIPLRKISKMSIVDSIETVE